MRRNRIFVIVPSLNPSGPINGAVALCNSLSEYLPVTLVSLKPSGRDGVDVDSKVRILLLENCVSWVEKYRTLADALRKSGGRERVVSVSFCFSADLLNYMMHSHAFTISSVRGNLFKNYRFDYGWPGLTLTLVHLLLLRRFDRVISISESMERQLRRFGLKQVLTIRNFIDEKRLERLRRKERQRAKSLTFVFLGSLSHRKRPELLVAAIHELRVTYALDCSLDLIGEGPLRSSLESRAEGLGMQQHVRFYGYLSNPYDVLQKGDCLVLPSESEGISRAAMEALFFGLPCILRDEDGNGELIGTRGSGVLFKRDEELIKAMAELAKRIEMKNTVARPNLLPSTFRHDVNVDLFRHLLNGL